MDLPSSDAAIVEDVTARPADVLRVQHNAAVQVEISKLLASTNPKQSDIREGLSLLDAGLTTITSIPDQSISKQIWNWIFDNIFGTRFLNGDGRTHRNVDDSTIDHKIALRVLLHLYKYNDSLLEDLSAIRTSSLVVCATVSEDKDLLLAVNSLLAPLLHQNSISKLNSPRSLVTALLTNVIRPAFAQSRSKNITAAGRKAIDPLPQALTASEDEQVLKPWKFSQKYVIQLLKWVLEHSNAKTIEDNWALIMPPVLTIIDDEATNSKIDGCNLLQILLDKIPAETWNRTGLGKVFEDALNPVLAYVPPLVEQNEAERLIAAIYPTLLSLCHHQFSAPDQRVRRTAMLDNLMRAGVLSGLSHSGENIKISVLLLHQMCVLLRQMEIYCVKHLKSIIPFLAGYLCDPFALASPLLLSSALTASRCLIVNAWPRMHLYSGELFKGMITCWQRSSEEPPSDSIVKIQNDLKLTLQLLRESFRGGHTAKEIDILLENDEALSSLLS